MTDVTSLVIGNVHLSVVVNPESTDNDVVNSCRYFAPCVVTTAPREQQMSNACTMRHSTAWLCSPLPQCKVKNNHNEQNL